MTDAFIGLGSNLGDSVTLLNEARAALTSLPQTRVTGVSPLYRSAPVGPQDQPDFFNAVVRIDTGLDAASLLVALQLIEQQAGRVRLRHWGERTLDLDILLYGNERIDLPNLQVPHPRLHQRAFVLKPLLDIAAEIALPDGTALAPYCATVEDQPICQYSDDRWSLIP
ncbi:MAG: 2-amino-4-hydroxy-6-hydroxymethyldihydropteridine diphosphokinase [Alcanivoracaceae bacterium]|jgi:2-amino-4-hydroxy-6-hydroxymethyldihydropteridine diphosphokinase|nr:2-amino-4-hydroxy-6-hydroxymethyldihydropteridine diphosphokinase [Alcanivoracaceae bacterium]